MGDVDAREHAAPEPASAEPPKLPDDAKSPLLRAGKHFGVVCEDCAKMWMDGSWVDVGPASAWYELWAMAERAKAERAKALSAAWENLARERGAYLDDLDEDVPDDHPIAIAWAALRALGAKP